jgi:nucleoside-diphosphate-sugar epimerase
VPSFLDGRVTVESLDVTDRDAFLALGDRHDIRDIVHLAGSIPDEDPVSYFRTDTIGLFNALDAARAWGVRRCAVASSLGVYIGRTEIPGRRTRAGLGVVDRLRNRPRGSAGPGQ